MFMTRRKLAGWPLVVLAGCAFFLVYVLQRLLVPFALAGGLAYVLSPAIGFAHRRWNWPRSIAVVVTYIVTVAVLAAVSWRAGSHAYAGASQLLSDGQEHWNQFTARMIGGQQVRFLGQTIKADEVAQKAHDAAQKFLAGGGAQELAKWGAGLAFGVILFLVLLFYFLFEGPKLGQGTLELAPPEYRPALREFAAQAHPVLWRYVSGLIVVVTITSLLVWAGVGPIFHLPHPWLLAIMTGILELVPVAGPTLSACLLGVAAIEHGGNAFMLVGFAAFCFAVRIGIDQVVGPIVLGRAVKLSPIVVIFAFLAGGMLFGMLGVLLAIPTTAMIKLALENYYSIPVE